MRTVGILSGPKPVLNGYSFIHQNSIIICNPAKSKQKLSYINISKTEPDESVNFPDGDDIRSEIK